MVAGEGFKRHISRPFLCTSASRREGESAEQSHEKGIRKDLSAGLLLLNSQREPQKFPFLKAQELQSRETFFSGDTTEAISLAELGQLDLFGFFLQSFQVKTPHFPPHHSFISSVANKAHNYDH